MTSTFSNNLQLELQSAGDNSGTWGDPTLNQNVFQRIDAAMGSTLSLNVSASTDVTLTQTQWRNANIVLTGTVSGAFSVIFPLNVNSATVAVGGSRVIDNQTSGTFAITVKTEASGSTGVVVPQGVKSVVVSDTANVTFGDSRLGTSDITRMATVAGSPNGVTTGVAPTAVKPASLVLDRTNRIIYAGPTSDGTTGWVPQNGYFPPPQGYLTLTSATAIITGDVTSATAVYYTPYVGNMVPIYDGAWLQAYFFTEQTLTLSSSQAASQIYDVFAFLDSGTFRIGTGPAWATPTAGSGARGSGAGTTQLSRINGLWTNTVSMTMRNGASTYSVAANQGTYLGSLFMDATNGQVSCYRSVGQSRKWGVWNAYNRVPVVLSLADSTASWTYGSGTIRQSNASTSNTVAVFSGLAEEITKINFGQMLSQTVNNIADGTSMRAGIGLNSTTAFSGSVVVASVEAVGGVSYVSGQSKYTINPSLGLNNVNSLENANASLICTFYGTAVNMNLTAEWRA